MFTRQEIIEPIIFEPEDWTHDEFNLIRKIFGLPCAERIVIRENAVIESYSPEAEVAARNSSLNSKAIALNAIITNMLSKNSPLDVAKYLRDSRIPIQHAREVGGLTEDILRIAYNIDDETVPATTEPENTVS